MNWTSILAVIAMGFLPLSGLNAMPAGVVPEPLEKLVPQRLLGLMHAPEVHEELRFSANQVNDLEILFSEMDGPWFRSRNLPIDRQRPIIEQLEQQLLRWFAANASPQQQNRLDQLELQSQSVRMLLRSDVDETLQLDQSQRDRLVKLANNTHEAERQLRAASMEGETTDELTAAVRESAKLERAAFKNVLRPDQHQKLWDLLGQPFDTSKLRRVYPMAPEFVAVKQWINSDPLTMKQLRGKIVLVHFYAFQCHNCHANFDVYRRWHEQLRERNVVVVGIQTPETARERDPSQVKAAAVEQNLQFPIMIDLESENWKAWGNTVWPTAYVVDQNGYIRQWWQGELRWQGAHGDKTIEGVIEAILAE